MQLKPSFYSVLIVFILQSIHIAAGYGQSVELRKLHHGLSKEKDSIKYVDLLNDIGYAMHLQNADSCFKYGVRANEMAARHRYKKGQADALANIAVAFSFKGINNQALAYYSRALQIYKELGNQPKQVQMLMNLSTNYSEAGDTVRQKESINRALFLGSKLVGDSSITMVYANYANSNLHLSADSARYYLDKAQATALKYHDERTWMYVQQIKADKLLSEGHTESALPFILSSIAIAKKHQWYYHELDGMDLIAKYDLKKGNTVKAITMYKQIAEIARENEFVFWKTDVLRSLVKAYKIKGDPAEIIAAQDQLAAALQEEITRNSAFISDYVAYAGTREKVTKLESGNMLKSSQISWLIVMISFTLIIMVIAIVLYHKSRESGRRLKELNSVVRTKNLELMASDEFKGKLISMLAHDFRAPIGSTLSIIGLLKDREEIPQEQLGKFYQHIEIDLNNVLSAFDNILQWIKKQLSGYVYLPQHILLNNAIEQTCMLLHASLDRKSLIIGNLIDPAVHVTTDPEVLQFVNRNILNNAVKFSPAGGQITITSETVNNEIVVSIADQGGGIREEDLEQIFVFNASRNSVEKGAGIALSICREMIEKIGGRIWAERLTEKGTAFKYALPVNPVVLDQN
jgi:signal transduction histidine kinase